MIPGVNREPLKKIDPDPDVLLRLLYGWRDEAIKAGKQITRIAVAHETGRDSFWLARWLRDRALMHGDIARTPAKKIDAVRTPEEVPLPPNTAAALRRLIEHCRLINQQIKAIEKIRLQRLQQYPAEKFNVMLFLLVRIIGVGVEMAERLVHEILSRNPRDRKAVARYARLIGSPDEAERAAEKIRQCASA
jgi:hypothetical protein